MVGVGERREAAGQRDGVDELHPLGPGQAAGLLHGADDADLLRVVLLDDERDLRVDEDLLLDELLLDEILDLLRLEARDDEPVDVGEVDRCRRAGPGTPWAGPSRRAPRPRRRRPGPRSCSAWAAGRLRRSGVARARSRATSAQQDQPKQGRDEAKHGLHRVLRGGRRASERRRAGVTRSQEVADAEERFEPVPGHVDQRLRWCRSSTSWTWRVAEVRGVAQRGVDPERVGEPVLAEERGVDARCR